MKLRAIRQLSGDYGHIAPGGVFDTTDEIAESLMSRGLAEVVRVFVPVSAAPTPIHSDAIRDLLRDAFAFKQRETKVIAPEEISGDSAEDPAPAEPAPAPAEEVQPAPIKRGRGRPPKVRQ